MTTATPGLLWLRGLRQVAGASQRWGQRVERKVTPGGQQGQPRRACGARGPGHGTGSTRAHVRAHAPAQPESRRARERGGCEWRRLRWTDKGALCRSLPLFTEVQHALCNFAEAHQSPHPLKSTCLRKLISQHDPHLLSQPLHGSQPTQSARRRLGLGFGCLYHRG